MSANRVTGLPFHRWGARPIPLPPDLPPMLTLVVDTEEIFDWNAPFSREAGRVQTVESLDYGQRRFVAMGLHPAYLVDYPVIADPQVGAWLREMVASGQGVVGAHLHPWVNPPWVEEVSRRNSFPGNLPRGWEAAKLAHLTQRLTQVCGSRPEIYKAGRYGCGPHTGEILEELGYEIDVSPSPPFDYRSEEGPDFRAVRNVPYWFGRERRVLGLTNSGGFVGGWRGAAPWLYPLIQRPVGRCLRLPGILARLHLLSRVRLSPEGFVWEDLRQLLRWMLAQGERILVLSLHSPSLQPGATPYVPDAPARERLLECCQRVVAEIGRQGGQLLSLPEMRQRLEALD